MKRAIILNIILLITVPAMSQTEGMIVPSDLKQQTIITEPATLHKGFFRMGILFDYGVVDKIFNEEKKKDYIPESTWASSWDVGMILQYGATDRLTFDLVIPYRNEIWNYYQSYTSAEYNTTQEESWNLQGKGLSDIFFSTRYQLISESVSSPSLTGSLHITLPVGKKNPENVRGEYDYDLPTGYGTLALQPELRLRKISYPFSYIAYLAYTHNLPGTKLIYATDTQESEFKYGNRIDLGASLNFHINDWVAVTNDLNYFFAGKGQQENVPERNLYTKWGLSYEARLVFQIRRVRLAEAVRIPLKGKMISADPLYVILLQYTF